MKHCLYKQLTMQIRCKKRCHSFIGMLRDHLEKIKDGYKAILQQQTAAAPQAEATAMLGMHSTCFVCREHIGLYSYAFSQELSSTMLPLLGRQTHLPRKVPAAVIGKIKRKRAFNGTVRISMIYFNFNCCMILEML